MLLIRAFDEVAYGLGLYRRRSEGVSTCSRRLLERVTRRHIEHSGSGARGEYDSVESWAVNEYMAVSNSRTVVVQGEKLRGAVKASASTSRHLWLSYANQPLDVIRELSRNRTWKISAYQEVLF